MNDKKQVANFLLEIAKTSKTDFIDDAKIDKEIIEAAKKINLILPNSDISVFRTVWAEIDKKNLNGVILPRKVVEDGLQTILFKQCNWEHEGAYNICGVTISAKINGDKIETINIFYKSLFPDKFEELKEKIKSGEAAVSFEIWSIDPETKKSTIKVLADGTKEFIKMIVHGTGVLLCNPPACPRAKIFSLVAKKELQKAEQIVNNVFEQDLVYAQLAIEEPKCLNCGNCKKEEFIVEELENKQISEEPKTEEKATETKTEQVAETKVEEPKVEETKTEVAQPLEIVEPKIIVKVTRIHSDVSIDTYIDGTPSGTSQGKSTSKTITEYKDGTQDVIESESEYKQKYDLAQLEEAVNKAKEELANLHKAELETKTNEIKVDLEKKITDKETEITNLKQELVAKAQEIAELTKPVEEASTTQASLDVGNVEVAKAKDKKEIEEAKENINTLISNKHKK